MVETAVLDRVGPLAGRLMASVVPLPRSSRFSLRGIAATLRVIEASFGVAPGEQACRAQVADDRAALWLGPDEWILTAPDEDGTALLSGLRQALDTVPHSLVDISHRNTGFMVSGTGAAMLLAEGCPLDLDAQACPIGMCTRTVIGKCEVVLWRLEPDAFRIECWRSFAPYLSAFLAQAAENI